MPAQMQTCFFPSLTRIISMGAGEGGGQLKDHFQKSHFNHKPCPWNVCSLARYKGIPCPSLITYTENPRWTRHWKHKIKLPECKLDVACATSLSPLPKQMQVQRQEDAPYTSVVQLPSSWLCVQSLPLIYFESWHSIKPTDGTSQSARPQDPPAHRFSDLREKVAWTLLNKGAGPHQRKSYPESHGTWQQVHSKMEEQGVKAKAPSHPSSFNYKSQGLGGALN